MQYKKSANLPTRAITLASASAALDIILTTIPLIPYGPSAGVIVKHEQILSRSIVDEVRDKVNNRLIEIENKQKTFGWKMRAKVGTKKKSYNDAEELTQ